MSAIESFSSPHEILIDQLVFASHDNRLHLIHWPNPDTTQLLLEFTRHQLLTQLRISQTSVTPTHTLYQAKYIHPITRQPQTQTYSYSHGHPLPLICKLTLVHPIPHPSVKDVIHFQPLCTYQITSQHITRLH